MSHHIQIGSTTTTKYPNATSTNIYRACPYLLTGALRLQPSQNAASPRHLTPRKYLVYLPFIHDRRLPNYIIIIRTLHERLVLMGRANAICSRLPDCRWLMRLFGAAEQPDKASGLDHHHRWPVDSLLSLLAHHNPCMISLFFSAHRRRALRLVCSTFRAKGLEPVLILQSPTRLLPAVSAFDIMDV